MITDLVCLYCGTTAFAVVNLEINPGRARWPVCQRNQCIDTAMHEASKALHQAAGKVDARGHEHPDAIDVDGSDAPTRSVLSIEQIRDAGR